MLQEIKQSTKRKSDVVEESVQKLPRRAYDYQAGAQDVSSESIPFRSPGLTADRGRASSFSSPLSGSRRLSASASRTTTASKTNILDLHCELLQRDQEVLIAEERRRADDDRRRQELMIAEERRRADEEARRASADKNHRAMYRLRLQSIRDAALGFGEDAEDL